MTLVPPDAADDWTGLAAGPLPHGAAVDWATVPGCGAVVSFAGVARDHSPGRPGVEQLAYEAYEGPAVAALADVAAEARRRWPDVGRLALLHRVGVVPLQEAAVVVVASAPHREEAFAAARFAIDELKATAPIWKKERWAGGDDWGLGATDLPLEASR